MKLYHLSPAFFIFSARLLDIISNIRFRVMYVFLFHLCILRALNRPLQDWFINRWNFFRS
jgi:hypothetical protein